MNLSAERPLCLVGAGNMGGALLAGWLKGTVASEAITVLEPQPSPEVKALAARQGFMITADASCVRQAGVVVLAVKPQLLDDILGEIGSRLQQDCIVISIAAGRTLQSLEVHLTHSIGCVRAMPNMPAAVGAGITAAIGNRHVDDKARAITHTLLSAVGEVVWLDHEEDMNAVTAVSGSGPAYVFYLVECFTAAAMGEGLSEDIARRLARATVSGAGVLLAQSDKEAQSLRESVTSKGGTTAAALDILMADGNAGLSGLLRNAIKAARRRAEELAK